MKVEHEGDVTRYVLRQSDINTFLICPERARQLWAGDVIDHPSAETAIGTAVHFAIEAFMDPLDPFSAGECLEAAVDRFRGESEQPGFRWVKIKTVGTAEQHITNCFNTFLRDIEPLLGHAVAIEKHFRALLYHWSELDEFDNFIHCEIWLEGTIDLIDHWGTIWDWKTVGRLFKYTSEGWLLDRSAVQPTAYSYGAYELELVDPERPIPFTYAVMQRTPCASTFKTVYRDYRHWDWLTAQCLNIVKLYEADVAQWPVNDQHALCSPDWCPAWANCKGRFFTTESGLSLTSSGHSGLTTTSGGR